MDPPAVQFDIGILGDVVLGRRDGHQPRLPPQCVRILAIVTEAVLRPRRPVDVGTSVSSSVLSFDLWGDDSPTCLHRLSQQVGQIHAALPRGIEITSFDRRYQLQGTLDGIDAVRFERLVDEARHLDVASRADRLEQALGTWRGPAFQNVDSTLVDGTRRHLEAVRARAELDLGQCELELRRPGTALDALQRRFDEDPDAPDVAALLAELRAIGQPDAARLVIRVHERALQAVGLTVHPDLLALERRILRHEYHSPVPASILDPDEAFHMPGRLLERRGAEDEVRSALSSGAVLVTGEAGVGKTVLARSVARRLQDSGAVVVEARARAQPTRPMEALAGFVDGFRAQAGDRFAELTARPTMGAAVNRLSGDPAPPGALVLTRDVLVTELASLVRAFISDVGGTLVVDDCQWLDHTSAEILGDLIADGVPRVLLTSREPLRFGGGWDGVATVDLAPFSLAEVESLARLAAERLATPERVETLHRSSGGNGLFLRLELDRLVEGADIDTISPTVVAAVNKRTARLSEETRKVLQTAALLGWSFPLRPLELVHPRAHEVLSAAVGERLVWIDRDAGRGEFLHGLVVDALVDALLDVAREEGHDQLCQAMIELGESPVAIATHALGAERLDPVRAVLACLHAARQQADVFEWPLTIAWASRALDAGARSGYEEPEIEAELRALIGTGMRRINNPGSADQLQRASDLAWLAGAHELLVRCVVELCSHGPTTKVGTVDEAARRHLERALEAPVADSLRAELLSAAATLMALSDDAPLGRALYREALATAESSGDPAVLRSVRMNAHLGLCHPDDLQERRRACRGLLKFEDPEAQWEGNFLRFGLALIDADRAELEAATDALRRLTAVVKARDQGRALLQIETVWAYVECDLDRAERLAADTFEVSLASYPTSWATGIYAALLVPVREAQGRAGELEAEVSSLVASAPGFVTWHAVAANVAYARGDRAAMAHEIACLAAVDFQLAEDLTWTAVATMLCRPVWSLRDVDATRLLMDRLAPYSGMMTWNGLSTHGPVDAGLACLADVLGDAEAVGVFVQSAVDMVERFGTPHLLWKELATLAGPRVVTTPAG